MPSRPSAPSSLASSRGKTPRSNQPATSGCTRSSTNRLVASRMPRSSSLRCPATSRKSSALAVRSSMLPSCLAGPPSILVWDHGGGDQLDLGVGVEQGGHLEEGDGGVVAAEMAAPGDAELGLGGSPGGGVGDEDLDADQVVWLAAGGGGGGGQGGGRHLGHAG